MIATYILYIELYKCPVLYSNPSENSAYLINYPHAEGVRFQLSNYLTAIYGLLTFNVLIKESFVSVWNTGIQLVPASPGVQGLTNTWNHKKTSTVRSAGNPKLGCISADLILWHGFSLQCACELLLVVLLSRANYKPETIYRGSQFLTFFQPVVYYLASTMPNSEIGNCTISLLFPAWLLKTVGLQNDYT